MFEGRAPLMAWSWHLPFFLMFVLLCPRVFSFLSHSSGETALFGTKSWFEARRCLQNCYVLKYHWAVEQWRRSRLSTWVPELEGIATWSHTFVGHKQSDSKRALWARLSSLRWER